MSNYLEKTEIFTTTLPNGCVEVRTDTITLKDMAEIARQHHREALAPGQDITNQDSVVQSICNAIWTTEVITTYKNSISSQ